MGKDEVMSGLALILGNQPSHSTKDDRIILQKLVFLLKYMKNAPAWSKTYYFGWYINGPYSSALANDYYSQETNKTITFSDTSPMLQLRDFLGSESLNSNELELLASIIYQIDKNPYLKENKDLLANKIFELKSKYTKDQILVAYSKLLASELFQI